MNRAIFQSVDLIAAVLGAVIGAVIIIFSYVWRMQQQDIGIALLLACVLYILLRKKFSATANKRLSPQHSRRILILTNIVFLIAFAASILLLRFNLYYRPTVYFVLVSIAAASIAFEIFYTPKENRSIPMIILKIVVLSVSVRAGIFYEFPTLMGADEWAHTQLASAVADTGHMSTAAVEIGRETTVYQHFPIFHVLVAATKLVTNTSAKDALFISIGLASVFSTIFIYLTGKYVGGVRLGLMAMLILNMSDMMIVRGVTNVTTGSLVLCYFMLLLFLIFRQRLITVTISSLMLLLVPIIILTHQLTVFATLVMLIGLFIGKWLYEQFYEKKGRLEPLMGRTQIVSVSHVFILIFFVGMIAYWMYYPVTEVGSMSFFDQMVYRVKSVFGREVFDPFSSPYVISLGSYSILSNFLYHVGYVILLHLAAMGALIWLSFKRTSKAGIMLIIAVLLLLISTYVSPLTGLGLVFIPHRFLPFACVVLALLAAQSIVSLADLLRQNWHKSFLASAVVLLLTFFMLTTPFICPDAPYAKERTTRTGFRNSEVQAASTVARVYDGKLMIEGSYVRVFKYIVREYDLEFTGMQANIDSSFEGMVILGRDLLVRETHVGGPGTFGVGRLALLGQDFFDKVDQIPGACLVYNNHEVIAYIIEQPRK